MLATPHPTPPPQKKENYRNSAQRYFQRQAYSEQESWVESSIWVLLLYALGSAPSGEKVRPHMFSAKWQCHLAVYVAQMWSGLAM